MRRPRVVKKLMRPPDNNITEIRLTVLDCELCPGPAKVYSDACTAIGRNKPTLARHFRSAEPANWEPSQTSGHKEQASVQLP